MRRCDHAARWVIPTHQRFRANGLVGAVDLDLIVQNKLVRSQCAAIEADPDVYGAIYDERFDPCAGLAFYESLASLPDHALVDSCPCPLYCFWGDEDTDAVAMVMSSSELSQGLAARGVAHHVYRGFDHEGLNARLEVAWPDASAWLSHQLAGDEAS